MNWVYPGRCRSWTIWNDGASEMERDQNSALSYYGWCSKLPYRTIFFPTPPALDKEPLSSLPVKEYVLKALRRQKHCVTIGDILDLSDQDILEMRHLGPQTFYEIREALLFMTGGVIESHTYFYDPDVKDFLSLLPEGKAPKKSDLDSRKWMASLYYNQIEER